MSGFVNRVVHSLHYRLFFDPKIGLYRNKPAEVYLKKRFFFAMDRPLSLDAPQTFNEKLQWLKLYDHKPIYTTMADKLDVKDYVAAQIGRHYIIPTLGHWNKPETIDFAALPDQFVLKCNHNSGTGMYICKNKAALTQADIRRIKIGLKKGLSENYYAVHREWPYKNVKPCILAEQYLETETGDLPDYKLHCFNGKVKVILVCRNRFGAGEMTEDFFSETWEHLPIRREKHPNSPKSMKKPEKLAEMIRLAEKLSADIPFLRVDFYLVRDQIYFGELTFFPASGFEKFIPEEWDTILGSYLQLPT